MSLCFLGLHTKRGRRDRANGLTRRRKVGLADQLRRRMLFTDCCAAPSAAGSGGPSIGSVILPMGTLSPGDGLAPTKHEGLHRRVPKTSDHRLPEVDVVQCTRARVEAPFEPAHRCSTSKRDHVPVGRIDDAVRTRHRLDLL